jgi:tetratricopeptide (TPR) repeat protein
VVEIMPSRGSEIEESIEEVRFYLGQGMVDQADAVLKRLEAQAPDSPELAMLRVGVDSAKQSPEAAVPEPEVSIEEPVQAEIEEPVVEAVVPKAPAPAAPSMTQPWPQARPAAAQAPPPIQPPQPKAPAEQRPVLQELVSDLEESLGDDFLAPEPARPAAPSRPEVHAQVHVEPEQVPEPSNDSAPEFRSNSLDDFVSDLEASLGSEPADVAAQVPKAYAAAAASGPVAHASTMPMAPAQPRAPQPPAHVASHASGAGVDLADMFGELKQELEGETASADEDPETHYNLGVAFREMGLLDEAIGEFQKVTQAAEHGHAFSQLMQTYTWLAQCFLDKGLPQAAVRWYETALKMPGIDQETRTALHYELASSWESAGNKAAALNNFLEVYGSNIDYRDVGERIKALRS